MDTPVIVIVGPTASGKTSLSIDIAKKVGGEVISADSRQVYRGLDIGTGKVTKKEMSGVPHHLLDVASPKKIFTANDFVQLGRKVLADIRSRGNVPIIVGGTGFYIDALLGRISLADVKPDKVLRKSFEHYTAEELFQKLMKINPARAEYMDTPSERNNKARLIRALEIASTRSDLVSTRSDLVKAEWIGITVSDEELRTRINTRLASRLKSGMVAEARRLHTEGLSYKRMEDLGLEYGYLARFLKGEIDRSTLESELRIAIRQYAKRQMTYWKRNTDIHWYTRSDLQQAVADIIQRVS